MGPAQLIGTHRLGFHLDLIQQGLFFATCMPGQVRQALTLQPSDTLSINGNLQRRVIGSVPLTDHLLRNWERRPFENNIAPLLEKGAMLSVSH